KINVPAEILSKPGRLSEPEFKLIQTHPQVGHDILKGIEFPWPIAHIILQHHEMMNGTGYPNGLSGEEICLEARILSVADVIEAMSSHRPYRPTLVIDKAIEEISQNKGILYDPDVADACLKVFADKDFKLE
ncbi:MAG: HD domain-containing protein, partial [Deltaproteobacteria bacterium]|nr:HD domain-containing protein [Deltaproteobacteria bacterium]